MSIHSKSSGFSAYRIRKEILECVPSHCTCRRIRRTESRKCSLFSRSLLYKLSHCLVPSIFRKILLKRDPAIEGKEMRNPSRLMASDFSSSPLDLWSLMLKSVRQEFSYLCDNAYAEIERNVNRESSKVWKYENVQLKRDLRAQKNLLRDLGRRKTGEKI